MKLITNFFKIRLIRQLINLNPNFYVFISRHLPFTNDFSPPNPIDSYKESYIEVTSKMIAAKYVDPTQDIAIVVPRITWSTNTVYTEYSHETNVYGNNFYVAVSSGTSYDIFKCLSNANGSPSTYSPDISETSPSDQQYETSDGYIWKYMYSANTAYFNKFSTREYMPVVENANVSANAVNGAIDVVKITFPGSDYNSYTSGLFQGLEIQGNNRVFAIDPVNSSSNNNFYDGCAIKIVSGTGSGQQRTISNYNVVGSSRFISIDTGFDTSLDNTSRYEISPRVVLVGDGNNFVGRALVNSASSNSIYKIEITNRGSGFTYAVPYIFANTGGLSNTAVLKPIFSPPGGHGFDSAAELGAKHFCIATTFDADDSFNDNKLINANDFRSYGILNRPLFSNVVVHFNNSQGTFSVGDTVTQPSTNATGIVLTTNSTSVSLTNVSRHFYYGANTFIRNANNTANGNITRVNNNGSANLTSAAIYFNQTTIFNIDSLVGNFQQDEIINGSNNDSTAFVYFSNSSVVMATDVKGDNWTTISGSNSFAVANVTSRRSGDFVRNSGELLYIENIPPVNKYPSQTETFKTIIEI